MRKLWVKAWLTLDGVFDAETMDSWWQNTNSPERMRYITAEYANGDAYLLVHDQPTSWVSESCGRRTFAIYSSAIPKQVP